jgi:hypothetical protein
MKKPVQFSKKYIKKNWNQFSFIWKLIKGQFSLWFSHVKVPIGFPYENTMTIDVKNGSRIEWAFENHPTLVYIYFFKMSRLSPETSQYESHYVPQCVQNGNFFSNTGVYFYIISTPILVDEFRIVIG